MFLEIQILNKVFQVDFLFEKSVYGFPEKEYCSKRIFCFCKNCGLLLRFWSAWFRDTRSWVGFWEGWKLEIKFNVGRRGKLSWFRSLWISRCWLNIHKNEPGTHLISSRIESGKDFEGGFAVNFRLKLDEEFLK